MVTLAEIELLATLLQRAGVTQIEAMFANDLLALLLAVRAVRRAVGVDQ